MTSYREIILPQKQRASLLAMFIILILSRNASAQYFQFSQYNFTSQRINPAMTGSSKYASLDLISRTQKTGGDFNINSNFVAFAYPLLNASTGNPWSGIGISLMNDRSSGIYSMQEASLSYAIHIHINRYQQFSLGFKALYQSQQINLDGFTTGSQYVPDRGFDSGISSGETFQSGRTHYTTFSTGLYWQQVNKLGDVIAHWGISIFDVNRPTYSFLGNPTPVPISFVFTGSFRAYHKNENSVFPELLFTNSSATNVLNAGVRFRHELSSSPNQIPDKIDLLTKYVVGRSALVGIQFHRENFSFGVSYDFPFLKTNPSNLGALEVGLTLRKPVETRKKKEARRRQAEKEKRAARRNVPKKIPVKTPTKKDSVNIVTPPSEIQIIKSDTSHKIKPIIETGAKAGNIEQDPMVVEKITLHFHFDYNSVDLDDETEDYLKKLAQSLKDDPALNIKITGHTDNIGPEKFNLKLSLKRADAVRGFLVHQGIEIDRLESTGKGWAEPINDNDTEEGRAKNRRVEIVVFKKF